MEKPIVVVGSINLDLVARVNRHPVIGETVFGTDFRTFSGGKGANQAVALGRLGAPVIMIGKVGDDQFGLQLRSGLEDASVDTGCVEITAGPSGTALITTTVDGDNSIIVIPGANEKLLPEDIDRHAWLIADAAMVLAQMEIPRASIRRVGEIVVSAGVPFLLDPAPASLLNEDLLRTVTWLSPNESETRILLELEPGDVCPGVAAEFAERLLALGARNVVLKLGEQGVYLAGADVDPVHIDALRVKAVDTTAAGDAFNGAFAHALAVQEMAPVDAAEFACAVAALSVSRMGAQASMPTLPEVERFLSQRTSRKVPLPEASMEPNSAKQ